MAGLHRLPARLIRLSSLCVCFALLFSAIAGIPFQTASSNNSIRIRQQAGRQNGNERRVSPPPARSGPPAANLPDLNEVRHATLEAPRAAVTLPSTMRSRRKPLQSRNGRRVGDPLPIPTPTPRSTPRPTPVAIPTPSAPPTPTVLPTPPLEELVHATQTRAPVLIAYNHFSHDFLDGSLSRFTSYSFLPLSDSSVGLWSTSASTFDVIAPPIPQAGSAKVVFASSRDGFMQIYVMNSDGTGQTRLTTDGSNNENPRWSPDGTKIVFQSDRDNAGSGLYDIYMMNSNGTGQTRLTTDPNDDCAPSWSADGAKIVFQSLRNGANYQIYTMNANGSGQTNISNTGGNETQPSWSPDGVKIAFASDRDHPGYPSIYVMNSNGSNQIRLTYSGTGLRDEQPAWSPNASRIAFTSTRDSTTDSWTETDDYEIPEDDGQTFAKSRLNTNKEVYVMNPDGSSQTRLTNDLSNDESPSWSPNGAQIVFRSDRERDLFDPTPQLWSMNADGSGQTNLSNSGDSDYSPSWTNGSGNQAPIANAGGPYNGMVSQNIPFNGGSSFDPDGTIATYSWSFGDGGTGSGSAPTHAFSATGNFTVTLTVTDNLGAQGSTSTTVNVSVSSSDQFVANFLQWGLGRAPTGDESSYWTDILRAAYPQGQTSMMFAMREFGMTVFDSSEYFGRNRSDRDFVYDCYKTYLMRNPDQSGWDYWTSVVPVYGRAAVRQGFEYSSEFANIVATLTASGTPSSGVSSLATAQVDPFNQSGNQLQARDAEWSASLVSLPGRAGLDLGLSLSYSSLVWTHSGPYQYFDQDYESLSPGFTIGFPTIQFRKFDAQTSRNVYMLTAAGRHVSLRQVATSNVYESADSSYLQLIDYGGSLLLRTTDGTQLSFGSFLQNWCVTGIKDRNGNFISVTNDWRGDIQNVTDTLNRTITFVYDANANLNRIEQNWSGQSEPHKWATFGWVNLSMQPTLSGVVGTHGGDTMPVLNFVGFDDGTYTKFLYNGNGQVNRITRYASDSNPLTDNHPRNYVALDYDSSTTDCPRLNAMRTWAEYWTGLNGVPTEVTTQFGIDGDKHTTNILGDPNGTVYKEAYGGTGSPAWQRGLVLSSEVWAGGAQQKVSTLGWTQDNTNVTYKTNPRIVETNVYDSTNNHRRTTVDYSIAAYTQYGLPYFVTEYAADGTELRRTYTDYNLSQVYLDRRIIGLVSAVHLTDAGGYQAKVTYAYDDPARISSDANTATMHDQSYDGSFTVRGNVTSTSRWDTTDMNTIVDAAKALTTYKSYNATGSIVSITDPAGHANSISYGDSFADGNNGRNTFAYPTTLTDADGFSSTAQYNFDFGSKTRTEGPPPQNQPNGVIQTFAYDNAARVQRVTTLNNGAYTHYVYGPNYVQNYSSVNNVAQNYWESDVYSITVFDGMGRGFTTVSNHPGSNGGYKLVNTIYDRMGRAIEQANPTEVNNSWVPTGDDDAVHYSTQTYDWKGRPRISTHPDGTYTEASYIGCGCAGGEVATLIDERNREQKVYSDVIGRTWKTEVWTWPDANQNRSVYSSTVSVYNTRDQVKIVNQYVGIAPSGTSSTNENASCPDGSCQKTSMTYDGYGRLHSKHVPEQEPGSVSTWEYNNDNTLHKATDPRGASATYTYNNARHLVNLVEYDAPAGITPTSNVAFNYDAVGNRTSMTDGLGSATYAYSDLSRLTSETRSFGSPLNQSYSLSYDYNLVGELKTINDPWGATINYGFDSTGRLGNVTGSGYGSVTQFLNSTQYRAWGTLESETYGNGLTENATYNSRMQMTSFQVTNSSNQPQMSTTTQFYTDGQVKFSHNALDERFDRAFGSDDFGRTTEAYSGSEARDFINGGSSGIPTGPYRQSYQFNPFNQITQQTNRLWSDAETTTSAYLKNCVQGWSYDAAGFATNADDATYTRDAAGRNIQADKEQSHASYSFDGDGRMLKSVIQHPGFRSTVTKTTYYLQSRALGGLAVAELTANGVRTKRYVYAGVRQLASEIGGEVTFLHEEPLVGSRGNSTTAGSYNHQAELNADGFDVGFAPPPESGFDIPESVANGGFLAGGSSCSVADPNCVTCYLDGMEHDCGHVMQLAAAGALQIEVQNMRGDKAYVDVDVTLGLLYVPGGAVHGPQDNNLYPLLDENGNPVPAPPLPDGSPGPDIIYVTHTNTGYIQPQWVAVADFIGSEDDGREYQHGRRRRRRSRRPAPKKPVDSRSACDKFAEELASRLWQAVAVDGGYNPDSRHDLGNEMNRQAIKDVDLNGYAYKKGSYPIDGFKDDLVNNGQDADVYHHILFTAGNSLHGTPAADLENVAFRLQDWKQANWDKRAESETELRDDDAGMAVGEKMLQTALAGKSGDYWALKAQIKDILCKY